MRNKLFAIVLAGIFFLPFLCPAQQAPAKTFKQGQMRQKQQENNAAACPRQSNTAFLRQRLANNENLSDTQKTELIKFFESQYDGDAPFSEMQDADAVIFFEQIANNPGMTQDEKKTALKSYFEQKKAAAKMRSEQQRMERKGEINSIRSSEIRESIQQNNTER